MDQKNCNFAVQVKEDSNTLFSETMHISGQFGRSACFDSWIEACLINQKDAAFINGMKENRSKSFTNSKGQICFFDNLSLSTGNMGCFTSRPDHVYGVNAKVSCVDTTSTPLYCAKNEKLAKQVLLVKQELECKEKDGIFQGDVYPFEQEDGSTEYCISASCDICGSEWFEEYVNQRKQSECCEKLGKEPNQGNGMCESPLPPSSSEIGVSYSQIKNFPGCSNITAGEGDKFCKVPQSSSSSEKSSSSQESSSSSDQSSSSENSSSSSESSSSSMDKSSSSSAESSSSKESSSSAESSSSEESSSSAESSSSEESSSSAESSSSENSSSSAKSSSSESSSSETGLCKTLPVDKIPYNAKSACFKNNGHCYKCKAGINESDCQNSWSWQNPNTPVNTYHWFNEVDCATGEKTDQGIGVCPAQPLDAIPSDLSNACFAMDGKCYKCKDPSPYGGCAQSWIWTQKLYYAEPYYLEEVDCYDPFEEEDEGEFVTDRCIDESFLKKEAMGENYQKVNDNNKEYYVDLMMTKNKYDALGRMRNHGSTQRKAYFNKKIPYIEEKDSRNEPSVSGTIVVSSDTLCDRLSSGEWVCGEKNYLARRLNSASQFKNRAKCDIRLGRDYGIVENGNLVGGMTCAWPNVITTKVYKELNRESLNDEHVKIVVHYTITSETSLGDNDHLTVKKGYVFPNEHVTTSEEENQFDKHEEGHEFYNNCVTFEEINTAGQFECSVKLKAHWSQKKRDKAVKEAIANELKIIENPLIENKTNEGQNKLDAKASRFHKDYGIGGYSDVYTCPTD